MYNNISLQKIIADYETNIYKKTFEYTLKDGQKICISIYKEQICHLLGLQYIYNKNANYLGAKGYSKIKSGEITINSLKKHNQKQFNFIKERLIYFDEIYEILTKGQLIKFYPSRVKPNTYIEADFIIFKNSQKHIYHLFLRKENNESNIYAAISFIVKNLKDKNPKQYIDRQEYKSIKSLNIIEK